MEEVKMGKCCICEVEDETVRNLIMLSHRSPEPGKGWGCVQCGLLMDGAVAVLCDRCAEASGCQPVFACLGYPGENRRIPVSELPPEHFDHDMSKHPEEAEAMAMAADFDEEEDDD